MNASDEEEMMNGAIAGPSNPSSAAPNATEAPQQGMSKNAMKKAAKQVSHLLIDLLLCFDTRPASKSSSWSREQRNELNAKSVMLCGMGTLRGP
jgi:hypothetical protein